MFVCVRAEKTGRNFLLESCSASSDSEHECNDDEGKEQRYHRTKPYVAIQDVPEEPIAPSSSLKANKLPPPPLGESGLVGSSVFTNPFKEQADERLSVLQKHVPLTLQARPAEIGGKKMCIAYRKDGRCRFGSRCKYAHDSDLQNSSVTSAAPHGGPETNSDQTSPTRAPPQTDDCQTPPLQTEEQDMDKLDDGRIKKRRVGLSQTLIPPKRALKQYEVQRQKDRATPF